MCGHQRIKGLVISSVENTFLPAIIVKQKLWPSIHNIRVVELVQAPIIEVAATKSQPIQLLNLEEKKTSSQFREAITIMSQSIFISQQDYHPTTNLTKKFLIL